jgi:hypothetical protein
VAARRKAALLLHLPATGAGKAGDFATFIFTDSAIELEAVLFQKVAALFRIWRGKDNIFMLPPLFLGLWRLLLSIKKNLSEIFRKINGISTDYSSTEKGISTLSTHP